MFPKREIVEVTMSTVLICSGIIIGSICILALFEICLHYYDKRKTQKLITDLDIGIAYSSLD